MDLFGAYHNNTISQEQSRELRNMIKDDPSLAILLDKNMYKNGTETSDTEKAILSNKPITFYPSAYKRSNWFTYSSD